jgi:hypothetical protein
MNEGHIDFDLYAALKRCFSTVVLAVVYQG